MNTKREFMRCELWYLYVFWKRSHTAVIIHWHFGRLFATPWAVAYQSPTSIGFSRQEYWSGLPFPSPGDLPDPGIEPRSPALQAESLPTELQGKSQKDESQRIDAFELLCWRRLLRIPWTAKRSNQSILKEVSPDYSLEGLMLKL